MTIKTFMQSGSLKLLALFSLLTPFTFSASDAHAWGTRGHGAVGVLAVERLRPETRLALEGILGSTDFDVVVGACYWSDIYRDMGDGGYTFTWHYINIDPTQNAYLRSRDCADRQCVTEAVNTQAQRLGNEALSTDERRVAFKHLCHFTGDLHQPLHVGYADDRGGNDVSIRFRGVAMDLHRYWDAGLIGRRTDSLAELLQILRDRPDRATRSWSPADTHAWTNESFSLTRNFAYPTTRTIDEQFETRSWQVTQQQLDAGSSRLAAILEVVLAPAPGPDTGVDSEVNSGEGAEGSDEP